MASNPIAKLTELIERVKQANSTSLGNDISSSSEPAVDASVDTTIPLGVELGKWGRDVAWFPIVPPGHTAFSWGEEDTYESDEPSEQSQKSIIIESKQDQPLSEKQEKNKEHTNEKKDTKNEQKEQREKKPKQQNPSAEEKTDKQTQKQKPNQKTKPPVPVSTPAPTNASGSLFSRLDIRVGKIVKAWKHPNADSLYVENIDIGESQPRQIVSGILKFYKVEELEGSLVLVVANLLPAPMRDVVSSGMVLAAANSDRSSVQLILPPPNSTVGERVSLQNEDCTNAEVEKDVNTKKKNSIWAQVSVDLKTDEQCVACYKGVPLVTRAGKCKANSLVSAQIS